MKKKEEVKVMKQINQTNRALYKTVKKMVPAVLIAMISTAAGLLSLYHSDVPMIQDFGSMLTIGIVIAFIVALFIFLPFLYIKDKHFPSHHVHQEKIDKPNKIVQKIVQGVMNAKYLILLVAVLLAGIGFYFDLDAKAETNLENFMPQDSQALEDIRELRTAIGSTEQIALVFEFDDVFTSNGLQVIDETKSYLNQNFQEYITEMLSLVTLFNQMGITDQSMMNETTLSSIPVNQQKLLINESRTKSVINISIIEMSDETFEFFIQDLSTYLSGIDTTAEITITGQSMIDVEMMKSLTSGRYEITILGLVLIFISLLVIYKSFYRALIPLIPIVLIIGWSGGIMAIFGISYTPLTATLGALIMGIGTEFTILITERYEEEKLKVDNHEDAIKIALSKMANPILVSALTTMGGFSALIFSDFVILSNFGIMTLVNLSLALLSTIIVLPAILALKTTKKVEVMEPVYSA